MTVVLGTLSSTSKLDMYMKSISRLYRYIRPFHMTVLINRFDFDLAKLPILPSLQVRTCVARPRSNLIMSYSSLCRPVYVWP